VQLSGLQGVQDSLQEIRKSLFHNNCRQRSKRNGCSGVDAKFC